MGVFSGLLLVDVPAQKLCRDTKFWHAWHPLDAEKLLSWHHG